MIDQQSVTKFSFTESIIKFVRFFQGSVSLEYKTETVVFITNSNKCINVEKKCIRKETG